MGQSRASVFSCYPQLATLRGKVPEEVVAREVNVKAPLFEKYSVLAAAAIPKIRLGELFPAELERGRITLDNFLGQWGNISVEEVCKIALIAKWLKPKNAFEFGTFNGMTTLQLAINTPDDCVIHTLDVDPTAEYAKHLDIGDIDRHLAQKQGAFDFEVGHYYKSSPLRSRVRQVVGDSLRLDTTPFEGKMDLVYIDAGHTYAYVKSDTEKALRMLRPGGVILWHDYFQLLHPDVTQRLYELAASGMKIFHLRGTTLAIRWDGGGSLPS